MKRLIPALCAALVLVFGFAVLAEAQSRPRGGGGGGGQSVAVPRGGGQSVAAPRGGGQSVAPPRGGGQSRVSAPSGPPPSARQRSGGQSGGTAVARPRGQGAGSGGSDQGSARPRGSGPVYGQAVPRGTVTGGRYYVPYRYYGVSPWFYYSPYAYGAFGLGFWGYDPYWWGGYYGYPYGWGYPYYGYGYGYGYDYGYYGGRHAYYGYDYGSIKLKVKPKEAEVYVDGYYMGQVDDFDGVFQHLDLESGTHRIEIRANGYQPLVLEMMLEPGRSVTYENRLRPLQEPPIR